MLKHRFVTTLYNVSDELLTTAVSSLIFGLIADAAGGLNLFKKFKTVGRGKDLGVGMNNFHFTPPLQWATGQHSQAGW